MNPYRKRHYLTLAALTGVLILAGALRWLGPVETGFRAVLHPLVGTLGALGLRWQGDGDTASSTDPAGERFREEIAALQAEIAALQAVAEENRLLREELGFVKSRDWQYRLANVLARNDPMDVSPGREVLIIDQGEADGVRPGLAVVNGQGLIVGKVLESKSNLSKVVLAPDRRCRLAAAIGDGQETAGIVEGDLGIVMKMRFIPQTAKIETGQEVVTSGLEDGVPPGLIIGRISRIDRDPSDVWQEATIEPALDYSRLKIVTVILPGEL